MDMYAVNKIQAAIAGSQPQWIGYSHERMVGPKAATVRPVLS
jgi:hypothetical protein